MVPQKLHVPGESEKQPIPTFMETLRPPGAAGTQLSGKAGLLSPHQRPKILDNSYMNKIV